jgi:hypothetical protein
MQLGRSGVRLRIVVFTLLMMMAGFAVVMCGRFMF